MAYVIDKSRCVRCRGCECVCRFGAVKQIEDGFFEIDPAVCVGCSACATICQNSAIHPDADQKFIAKVEIDKDNCIGCSLCARNCPVTAISGVIKQPYVIDQSLCIHCGVCATKCKKDAVKVTYRDRTPEDEHSPTPRKKSLLKRLLKKG